MVVIDKDSGIITFNLSEEEKERLFRRIEKEIRRVKESKLSKREKDSRLKYLNNIISKH